MNWVETTTLLNSLSEEKLHELTFLAFIDYGDKSFNYAICCWSFHQHCLIEVPRADPIKPSYLQILKVPVQ